VETSFGNRLKSARIIAGLSQDDLVKRINGIVKKTALAKYERGEMLPKPAVVEQIALALNQPVDFFFKPITLEFNDGNYRAKSSMGIKDENSLRQQIFLEVERYLELEKLAGAEVQFEPPFPGVIIRGKRDIEIYAIELRRRWGLGMQPIGSVMTLLESQGIRVIDLETDCNTFEGYSTMVNLKIPVIAIRAHSTTERRRFTALHELAHLIFTFEAKAGSKETERLCHGFAGAMLLPQPVFIETYGAHRTRFLQRELDLVKDKYGISAYAFVMRAVNLGVLHPNYLPPLKKYVTSDIMEKHIGANQATDRATRFETLLLKALYENCITINKGAQLSGLPPDEFIKIYTDVTKSTA